ncbi:hypothetical protein PROFUN_06914 [Planoprotostelium fungivorum]|uniref:Homeobox domain-containing protein n=1 Tax=Planoprotostelium fungivorum TaxID=1890364 RepID=A0A2P6NN01_9EUKA|nr:hypothetical protein PROFUN_06914 [Planoprotostelium fungivorum]
MFRRAFYDADAILLFGPPRRQLYIFTAARSRLSSVRCSPRGVLLNNRHHEAKNSFVFHHVTPAYWSIQLRKPLITENMDRSSINERAYDRVLRLLSVGLASCERWSFIKNQPEEDAIRSVSIHKKVYPPVPSYHTDAEHCTQYLQLIRSLPLKSHHPDVTRESLRPSSPVKSSFIQIACGSLFPYTAYSATTRAMDVKSLIHEDTASTSDRLLLRDNVFFFTKSLPYHRGGTMVHVPIEYNERTGKLFSKEQTGRLIRQFECNPFPDQQRRRELAEEMSTQTQPIGMRSIQIWFQNKRQRKSSSHYANRHHMVSFVCTSRDQMGFFFAIEGGEVTSIANRTEREHLSPVTLSTIAALFVNWRNQSLCSPVDLATIEMCLRSLPNLSCSEEECGDWRGTPLSV